MRTVEWFELVEIAVSLGFVPASVHIMVLVGMACTVRVAVITNNSKGQKHVALLVQFVFEVTAGSVECNGLVFAF